MSYFPQIPPSPPGTMDCSSSSESELSWCDSDYDTPVSTISSPKARTNAKFQYYVHLTRLPISASVSEFTRICGPYDTVEEANTFARSRCEGFVDDVPEVEDEDDEDMWGEHFTKGLDGCVCISDIRVSPEYDLLVDVVRTKDDRIAAKHHYFEKNDETKINSEKKRKMESITAEDEINALIISTAFSPKRAKATSRPPPETSNITLGTLKLWKVRFWQEEGTELEPYCRRCNSPEPEELIGYYRTEEDAKIAQKETHHGLEGHKDIECTELEKGNYSVKSAIEEVEVEIDVRTSEEEDKVKVVKARRIALAQLLTRG